VSVRIVGVVLVRNEDVFVERAVRNVAAVCDRIHVFDHESTDGTGDALARVAADHDHVTVERTHDARDSHRILEQYAGTDTWVLGVDGDELYDPAALRGLRALLAGGEYADAFHLKAHVLNCTSLELGDGTASGHMAPPSRPVTKLFNMAAVDEWAGCPQRLHGGSPRFRDGFDWTSLRYVSEHTDWAGDPLRMLHLCFLPRSSEDSPSAAARRNLSETGAFRRGLRGLAHRLRYRRHIDPRMKAYRAQGSTWKDEWYARGPVATVDARPFLTSASTHASGDRSRG
jgi:hypothetical protein